MAFRTGARPVLLLGLTREDIVLDDSGAPVLIHFSAVAHATISDYLQPKLDKLFNRDGMEQKYKAMLYTLRHSSASHLVAITGNVHVAMKLLNHSNIKTTMGYVKSNDSQLQEAVDL